MVRGGSAALGSGGFTKGPQLLPGQLASNAGLQQSAGNVGRGVLRSQLPSEDLKLMGAMCSPRARLAGEPGAGEGRLPPAACFKSAASAQSLAVLSVAPELLWTAVTSFIGLVRGVLDPLQGLVPAA